MKAVRLLGIIALSVIALVLLMCECESLWLLLATKVVGFGLFYVVYHLSKKYCFEKGSNVYRS